MKAPDKKARRELREKLLPAALQIIGETMPDFRKALCPSPHAENDPRTRDHAEAAVDLDRKVVFAVELADRAAVVAIDFDSVLEEREREAKREAKQKQRESDALKKHNRKALRGDFDAGPESVLT